jgi:hypothetical protein
MKPRLSTTLSFVPFLGVFLVRYLLLAGLFVGRLVEAFASILCTDRIFLGGDQAGKEGFGVGLKPDLQRIDLLADGVDDGCVLLVERALIL